MKQTFTVTLGDGRYTFLCDVHPTQMRGAFTSGRSRPAAGRRSRSRPPQPTAPVGCRLPLNLTVGPAATISLKTRRRQA